MLRQFTSVALMVCGVIALALGMTVAPAATPAAAMPAMQPSPRPTLMPTAELIPDDNDDPAPVAYGRVTGTVIDARTGAPVANRTVVVGDSVVVTDANGNYDRWVPPGAYTVGLQLREGEGVSAQGMQTVTVASDSTVVIHLYYTSAVPEVLVLAPEAPAPAPVVIEAAPAPASVMVLPDEIPETSVAAAAPGTLPETAIGGAGVSGAFVLVGALLFGLGMLLQVRPRRRAAGAQADTRMLRRMLTSAPKQSPEATLDELLRRDPQE